MVAVWPRAVVGLPCLRTMIISVEVGRAGADVSIHVIEKTKERRFQRATFCNLTESGVDGVRRALL
jgi:hypothetical protein